MCVRIDRKMSCSQTNYKLDEAQAIFNELRSIKKAISTGEKERQDLIQVLSPASRLPPPWLPRCSLLTSSGRAGSREDAFADV